MDSASTQNMDSHMAALILFSTVTILPSAAAIPSSGNESLFFGVHSSATAINNTLDIAFPHVYSTAMVPSNDFTVAARQTLSHDCSSVKHSTNNLFKIIKHKFLILEDANETLLVRPRCVLLY
jgi:hypothetical protein